MRHPKRHTERAGVWWAGAKSMELVGECASVSREGTGSSECMPLVCELREIDADDNTGAATTALLVVR